MVERAYSDDEIQQPVKPVTVRHEPVVPREIPGHREAPRPGTAPLRDVQREIPVVRSADRIARRRKRIMRAESPVPAIEPRPRSELLNRTLNVAIALTILALLSPLLLLVALAVKLTSKGPVIYTQTRVGIDRRRSRTLAIADRRRHDGGGMVFTIYKFRTMCVDAECGTGAVWAAAADPRVTTVGRFLRQFRLDELPQLWNVVKGDMNIVGPRPERPSIFMRLRNDIVEYPIRQRARPGITGLAQISQHYDTCLEDVRRKVQYDIEYLKRQGLVEDVRIMLKTVPVVIFRKGAW